MDYLIANPWIMWLAVGVLFLIVELLTTALVSIWFVPSAILTCLFSLAVDSIPAQIVVFVVLSAISMVISRKIYKKYIKKDKDEVSADSKLIGKTAKTTEDTDGNSGKVLVGDIYWKAVSETGEKIGKQETVIIKGVNGTTLVINKQ